MLLDDALDILATRLREIDGLEVVTDPMVTVTVPMAVVVEDRMDYNESFRRGAAELAFTVTVFVSRADSTQGLEESRQYLSGHGDKSIRQAIETQVNDDALLSKVVLDRGERDVTEDYVLAVFTGRAHIPGAVAT